mgnify:CR=1 FL=1
MQSRKVYLNRHNNLLSLEEHIYELVDVKEPHVFRNLFPYDEVPKIAFNDRIVPHNMHIVKYTDKIFFISLTYYQRQPNQSMMRRWILRHAASIPSMSCGRWQDRCADGMRENRGMVMDGMAA